MESQDLDPVLRDAVSGRRAVLFLGAGASLGATRTNGQKIPDAQALGTMLSKEFLNSSYNSADFKTIYDFACSTRSVRDVQKFLRETLIDYTPAPFHLLIPTFAWAGIITTNYDLIVEKSYEYSSGAISRIAPKL